MRKQLIYGLAAALALFQSACQSRFCQVRGQTDVDTLYLTTNLASDQPEALIPVSAGRFEWTLHADTARLCRLWQPSHPDRQLTFFSEPGHVTVKLCGPHPYVTGTPLNNEWQRLNDITAQYGQRIANTVDALSRTNTPSSEIVRRVTRLRQELDQHYAASARRYRGTPLSRLLEQRK